ncbi:MAG: cytochrome c3 family protein [Bacteroidales bacterium]|nr:cytochrome c3 family protein [Bacteroidales bacterium]MCF8457844.1 cytochrome c3 family protein [Bacteroidales bacterium]
MKNQPIIGIFLAIYVFTGFMCFAQEAADTLELPASALENESCLHCHGEAKFDMYNSDSSMVLKKHMYKVIDRDLFYNPLSVHREFSCTDCHSSEFKEFPHPLEGRFETPLVCMDCHEGDDAFAKFNFEGIAQEYGASIHHTELGDEFNCWSCHNPHGYILHARSDDNIKDIITYNNNVCLSCHSNVDKFELLTDRELIDIIGNHQWLPNQKVHFENVRCIDCHSKTSDTTLVAHQIQPKDKAVKNCVECHSQNSHLMASLYKFQTIEARSKIGFMNAVILNESYVIGANRNVFLNRASIIIFILTLLGIAVHAIIRMVIK